MREDLPSHAGIPGHVVFSPTGAESRAPRAGLR